MGKSGVCKIPLGVKKCEAGVSECWSLGSAFPPQFGYYMGNLERDDDLLVVQEYLLLRQLW